MVKEKVAFILCTNSELWFEEAKRYIERIKVPEGIKVEIIPIFNASNMTGGYNQGRNLTDAKYKIYMHHDTFIINRNLLEDVLRIFRSNLQIGIIGVVGADDVKNKKIIWDSWEYGKVLGCTGIEELSYDFGEVKEEYKEVDCVDGMLIATQYDIPWRDDLFKSWHFYDRSICLEYKRKGYISVVPKQEIPWCIHDCGYSDLGDWEKSLKIFCEEYQEYFSEECVKRSSSDEICETNRKSIKEIESSIENMINDRKMNEAYETLYSMAMEKTKLSKKIVFMSELMGLYRNGTTSMLFKEGDTVTTMLEKYTRAKFIFRRIAYGMAVSNEEVAFINTFSAEEQQAIIMHNLNKSLEIGAKT